MDGRVERNKDILKKVSMDAWNGRNYREEEERWYQMKGSRDVRREEKNHWMSDGKGRGTLEGTMLTQWMWSNKS